MSDGIQVTAGAGTTVQTDEIGGVHYQVVKIALGADGANDGLVDSGQQTKANSVPVAIASDQTWATSASSFAYGTLAYGSITGSYATLLTDVNSKVYVNVYNATDANILVSFNASNDVTFIPAGTSWTFSGGPMFKHIATNVSIKHDGTAPTLGTVYCTAIY